MKTFFLYFLKAIGFFRFSRLIVGNKFLILAYHGVEIVDESLFRPKLFIKLNTLQKRMKFLHEEGFNILSLNEALQKIETNELPKNSIVITVDDGWYSTFKYFDDVLYKYSFCYTVYVTTFYVKNNYPVLNVALSYIVWKTKESKINLDILSIDSLKGLYLLSSNKEKSLLNNVLFDYFLSIKNKEKELDFVKKVSAMLNVDYDFIFNKRFLSNFSFEEMKKMLERGVDIQLHTHIHAMINDENSFIKDMSCNKALLGLYAEKKLEHFCYPSGQFDPKFEPLLKRMGICSATTCNPGFVTNKTNRYYLPRFLDGENIPQIVFEAEVCGVLNLLRKIKSFMRFIENRPE